MFSPVDTFPALRGAAEHLACDVVTEVEPRPGRPGIYRCPHAQCCNFRCRAGFTTEDPSPVDRFYMDRDRAIVSQPASTRAALGMSAVGCDWRAAPC